LYSPILSSVNGNNSINQFFSIFDPLHMKDSALEQDELWTTVAPGDTVPFSFEGRGECVWLNEDSILYKILFCMTIVAIAIMNQC
jgi:hypothetical protein